jgi:D-glycero-D-manno-heptose 1,7-bisphosphate phosphatase
MLKDGNAKAVIDRHEFCPFHPDGSIEKYRKDSPLRKPLPGMIHQAADALALDLPRSWVIGDAPRDIEAGKAAGCRTILFTDPSLKASPAALVERKVEPDYVCSTLTEAIDFIARNTERAQQEEPPPPAAPVEATPASRSGEAGQSSEPAGEPSPHRGDRDAGVATTEERSASIAKLESIAAEILRELRHRREQPQADFSVSKLMAGVVQVIVLAMLFVAFLNRADNATLMAMLTFALTLQAMTIALLIMGRQR